jgi:hypothetical protein
VNPASAYAEVSRSRWPALLKVAAALLVLNFLTTFNNVWSTPWIQADMRIGADLVGLWVLLLLFALAGQLGPRAIRWLTLLFVLVVIGRYVEVSVPSWLGRKVNLYWDAQHLPKFIEVASQGYAWWQLVLMAAAPVAGLWLLTRLVRACISVLAYRAVPSALRSPAAWIATATVIGVVVAGRMQVQPFARYVSAPVFPVYQRQAHLLAAAFFPERFRSELPPSPPLESDLRALRGAEVKVVFLESYGATTYERDELAGAIGPARDRLERAAEAQGRKVLSAFVRAATFGGASDLSHLSFLSGIDLTDPIRHDLLLTTDRPTILDTFEKGGYTTIGLYPAMSWEWPEVSFYSFDHYLDAPSLEYRGPAFGLWFLPDQFSMARVDELFPPDPDGRPRFVFFPTINSHIPYQPTPPYQADWSLVTSAQPYPAEATARALADEIDWHDLFDGYIDTIRYTFEWLTGYQALPQPRDSIMILVGDHQPAGGITGPDASWNVPVHIITGNELIAERLRLQGFSEGMNPPAQSLGHISELTLLLLSVFDGGQPDVASATPAVDAVQPGGAREPAL